MVIASYVAIIIRSPIAKFLFSGIHKANIHVSTYLASYLRVVIATNCMRGNMFTCMRGCIAMHAY